MYGDRLSFICSLLDRNAYFFYSVFLLQNTYSTMYFFLTISQRGVVSPASRRAQR